METVVLVQEGALHELLLGTHLQCKLGTHLQCKLGFALMAKETRLTDLLTGEDYSQEDLAHQSVHTGGANQPL